MNINNHLYFSPKYKFLDLNFDDNGNLIKAFKDRMNGFYIEPTLQLNKEKRGFATGVLCVATIDYLSKFFYKKDSKRFIKLLKEKFKGFENPDPNRYERTLANRFYDEFRNGLIHEGRIKNAGQFSYDFDKIIKIDKEADIMIVNPNKLLGRIITISDNYIIQLEEDSSLYLEFKQILIGDFNKEIESLK